MIPAGTTLRASQFMVYRCHPRPGYRPCGPIPVISRIPSSGLTLEKLDEELLLVCVEPSVRKPSRLVPQSGVWG